MLLTEGWAHVLLLVAVAGVVALAVAVGVLARRLAGMRGAAPAAPARGGDLSQAVQRQAHVLERVRRDVDIVNDNTELLRERLRAGVSRVAVVHYDAFEDMGGALSFSLAMLDERGDGVVLSAINGRTEARTYAKPVRGGTSGHRLSTEETVAIQQALVGIGTAGTASSGRRDRPASA